MTKVKKYFFSEIAVIQMPFALVALIPDIMHANAIQDIMEADLVVIVNVKIANDNYTSHLLIMHFKYISLRKWNILGQY